MSELTIHIAHPTRNAQHTVTSVAMSRPCFGMGTHILTPLGDRLIQDLKIGDMVETLGNGAQPIRAIGNSRFEAMPDNAPTRFRAGTLNNEHDLCVTPDHRIRFAGWQADLLFGAWEVLVAARDFVNGVDVTREVGGMVKYVHLDFAQHHIIFAERVAVESFQQGARSLNVTGEKTKFAFPPLQAHEAQVLLRSYTKAAS